MSNPISLLEASDTIDQLRHRLFFMMDYFSKSDDAAPIYYTLESIHQDLGDIEDCINHEYEAEDKRREQLMEQSAPFRPFGEGVRVGGTGAPGNLEIGAHLGDLCQLHGVDHERAKSLAYPDGGVMLLQTQRGVVGAEIYLTAAAYRVFMAWVEGGAV